MRRGTLLAYIRAQAGQPLPMIPGTWDLVVEDARWCTIYPLGRAARPEVYFHCRQMVRNDGFTPARALFICVGQPVILQHLAERIAADGLAFTRTWADLPTFRADAQATAVALKAAFPDERPRDSSNQPIGTLLAFYARMAGFDSDDAEGQAA